MEEKMRLEIYAGISKLTMSAIMLLGRLEIMPLLVLLMPSVWRRK